MDSHNPVFSTDDSRAYDAAMKLNRYRANLFINRGEHVFPRNPGEIQELLKDGYFINVTSVMTLRGDLAFKFEIAYACENGCCYNFVVDMIDGTSQHQYKSYGIFEQIAPKRFQRWKYYTTAEHDYIDSLYEQAEEKELLKVAASVINDMSTADFMQHLLRNNPNGIKIDTRFDFEAFLNNSESQQ